MVRATTPVMRRTLATIAAHWSQHGVAPTVRELATAQGLKSTNAVCEVVTKLAERGLITRQSGLARTMKLTIAGIEEATET